MKTLEPVLVITSESGGLCAYRTRMVWCIVGPIINGDSRGPISCYRVQLEIHLHYK